MTVLTSRSPSGSESLFVSENVTAVSNAVSALSLTALGDCSDPGSGVGGGGATSSTSSETDARFETLPPLSATV